jgi:Zn-dependent membrane protease YugP
MRSALVPIVSFGSKYVQWILLGGILLINTFPTLLLIGIVMFAMITLFSFVTLPVEFDASKRALVWLKSSGTTNQSEAVMAKDALHWAAMTYVVAAISSLATLVYYVLIYMNRR